MKYGIGFFINTASRCRRELNKMSRKTPSGQMDCAPARSAYAKLPVALGRRGNGGDDDRHDV